VTRSSALFLCVATKDIACDTSNLVSARSGQPGTGPKYRKGFSVAVPTANGSSISISLPAYVIPLQGQIAARIEQLEGDKAKATSTSHRKKLQKEQDDLKRQQAELLTFEEKLKHLADRKISLDLDDGVKVNYGKFGDLLAESKAIAGSKDGVTGECDLATFRY
jgi:hypothetical protein